MITDALLQLAAAQAVTATAVSANAIDLGTNRDIGAGEPLYAVITVDQTVTAAGAATVEFQLISGSGVSGGVINAGITPLSSSGAIGKAELPAGRRPIVMKVNRSTLLAQPLGQRYLGAQFVVATGPLTAGQFTVNIVHDVQDLGKQYPSGFTVL